MIQAGKKPDGVIIGVFFCLMSREMLSMGVWKQFISIWVPETYGEPCDEGTLPRVKPERGPDLPTRLLLTPYSHTHRIQPPELSFGVALASCWPQQTTQSRMLVPLSFPQKSQKLTLVCKGLWVEIEVTLETSQWWMERTWVEIWGMEAQHLLRFCLSICFVLFWIHSALILEPLGGPYKLTTTPPLCVQTYTAQLSTPDKSPTL